jgi:hypothetical protein
VFVLPVDWLTFRMFYFISCLYDLAYLNDSFEGETLDFQISIGIKKIQKNVRKIWTNRFIPEQFQHHQQGSQKL